MKKIFITFTILIPLLANSAPPDFTKVLENTKILKLNKGAFDRGGFFAARHAGLNTKRAKFLTVEETDIVKSFSKNSEPFALHNKLNLTTAEYDVVKAGAEELYQALDKVQVFPPPDALLPNTSTAANMDIPEIYSVQATGNSPVIAEDSIVAHGEPMTFYENSSFAASKLGKSIHMETQFNPDGASGGYTLFRVKNPLTAKPIAMLSENPSEGAMVYNYGSSLKVVKVNEKDIVGGDLNGGKYYEAELVEVDEVDLYERVFSYGSGNDGTPIPIEELSDPKIPINMQVEVEGTVISMEEEGATGGKPWYSCCRR